MPLRKIPKLEDLCVKNIAYNIIRHGQKFAQVQNYTRTYAHYKTIQFLFNDKFLQELERIFQRAYHIDDDNLRKLMCFLFLGHWSDDFEPGSSLKFLFNEHTVAVALNSTGSSEEVEKTLLTAFTRCTNIRRLTLRFCRFTEDYFGKFQGYRPLTEIDLLFSECSDETVQDILLGCSSLRVLRASGYSVTDRCLVSLCRNQQVIDTFNFCQDDGKCCGIGQNIVELTLYDTLITKTGVICALQHLLSLEKFLEGGRNPYNMVRYTLPGAISSFHFLCCNRRQRLVLKLTVLICNTLCECRSYSTDYCCPSVDSFVYMNHSKKFLVKKKMSTMETMSICTRWIVPREVILREFVNFLKEIGSRKQFILVGDTVIELDGRRDIDPEIEPPSCVTALEKIHLPKLRAGPELEFFTEMLSRARNVKSLSLYGNIADEAFVLSMNENSYCELEEIQLNNADMQKISFQRFIENDMPLKRIILVSCENTSAFIKEHREMANKRNFELNIEYQRETHKFLQFFNI